MQWLKLCPLPLPQALAYSSCQDASTCYTGAGQCEALTGGKIFTPDEAWADVRFASVDLWVDPGTHTFLVRLESPLGCGGALLLPQCYVNDNAAYQVLQRERPCQQLGCGHSAALGAHAVPRL